jgi:hypothetical protein
MRAKNLINGRRWAYTVVKRGWKEFVVVICGEGQAGYRPLPDDCDDAPPHETEAAAEAHARRLNERLGVKPEEVRRIVMSTMSKPAPRRRRAA